MTLLFLFLTQFFYPQVQINSMGYSSLNRSGIIHDEDEKYYYILSILSDIDLERSSRIEAVLHSPSGLILYSAFKCEIVKRSNNHLVQYRIPKVDKVIVKPMYLHTDFSFTRGEVTGFSYNREPLKSVFIFKNAEKYYDENAKELLYGVGGYQYPLKGGGLIQDDKLIGITRTFDKKGAVFIPADVIKEFLEK